MKICWDNLEDLKYNSIKDKYYKQKIRNGKVYSFSTYLYNDSCLTCKQPFLYSLQKNNKISKYCSNSCRNKGYIKNPDVFDNSDPEDNFSKWRNIINKIEQTLNFNLFKSDEIKAMFLMILLNELEKNDLLFKQKVIEKVIEKPVEKMVEIPKKTKFNTDYVFNFLGVNPQKIDWQLRDRESGKAFSVIFDKEDIEAFDKLKLKFDFSFNGSLSSIIRLFMRCMLQHFNCYE